MFKVGDKVLIRNDDGNFTVPGIVTKAEKRARTISVSFGYEGKNLDGIFDRSDLQLVKKIKSNLEI